MDRKEIAAARVSGSPWRDDWFNRLCETAAAAHDFADERARIVAFMRAIPCTCDPSYFGRKLVAPNCFRCNPINDVLEEMGEEEIRP